MSALCYLLVRDSCDCFVFKYCRIAHVACTFADLLEKVDRRTSKQLEDSSNMVKSGYATMIKLENELSKQRQCLFDWSTLYPLFCHSNMSKFYKVKGQKILFRITNITQITVFSCALANRGTCNMEPTYLTWAKC